MPRKTAATMMRAVCIAFLAVAFVLFGAAFPATDEPVRFLIDVLKWPVDGNPAKLDAYARWTLAISGGLSAAFAIFSYMIVAPAIEENDKKVQNAALCAVLAWFVMDTTGSIVTGFPLNALFNLSFLVLYVPPLLLARAK